MRSTAIKSLFILMLFSWSAQSEVLLIDRVAAKSGVDVPQKSATMNQVRADYGDPIAESAPVGDPPITRWEYADFVVYFEHQHVITTVLKRTRAEDNNPAN